MRHGIRGGGGGGGWGDYRTRSHFILPGDFDEYIMQDILSKSGSMTDVFAISMTQRVYKCTQT